MRKSKYVGRGFFNATLRMNMERRRILFDTIAQDDELDIRPRGNGIHVYYRGGKILGINPSSYHFDDKYTATETDKELIKNDIKTVESEPDKYFADAKGIMDQWFRLHEKQERDDQHHIACANKEFTKNNDLVVIDIEYAVSRLSNVYNKKKVKGNPRFDIIAADKTGQLYVLELKTGIDSIGNMKKHVSDFNSLVGSVEIGDDDTMNEKRHITFATEMDNVLKSLQQYFGYSKDIHIDTAGRPIFMFAYTDKEKRGHTRQQRFEEFRNKAAECKTDVIKIEKPGYFLRLHA